MECDDRGYQLNDCDACNLRQNRRSIFVFCRYCDYETLIYLRVRECAYELKLLSSEEWKDYESKYNIDMLNIQNDIYKLTHILNYDLSIDKDKKEIVFTEYEKNKYDEKCEDFFNNMISTWNKKYRNTKTQQFKK